MKKHLTACIAGAVACAVALGTAGCAQADEKYQLFSDPMLTIKSTSVEKAVDISDLLFGLFLEDINYASYAMDDNIVANGNFEALGTTPTANNFGQYWSALSGSSLSIEELEGIFATHNDYHSTTNNTNVNPHYAKITASNAGGGILNRGYAQVPMALRKGDKFKFSAFVKAQDGAAKMTVRLTDGNREFAKAEISLPQGSEWIKYERTLEATNTGREGIYLELSFDKAGVYCVDAVSFETTLSTCGIKDYIYEAIADLSPKFMRFPGGCIIEGDAGNGGADTKEVYDWKNSIGAVQSGSNAGDDTVPAFSYKLDTDGSAKETTTYGEWATRSNNYDLWGYNMDYGLGFYEYFLLCDSIGASPVPIVNCGYSDQGGAASGGAILLNGRHNKKVDDYIQDALNLIEFANGDTTTKWGKIREQMGHAEPFNLKYIGVGNEQFGDIYYDCYQQFLEKFHAAQKANPEIYGGVQPIVGNGLVFGDCQYAPNSANLANIRANNYKNSGKITNISEYGVVDHHYYMGYNDFFHFATPENCIYDKYSRDAATGYKVFVGEYSANAATRYFGNSTAYQTNTWLTALSEAAYMTGLERNGDVVDLAAYAPMFGAANVDSGYRDDGVNQWDVDMMYYTNTELLRSPNYFVQQIFMKNAGTQYVASELVNVSDDYEYDVTYGEGKVDILYHSITIDEKTGDIIVKIVNAGEEALKLNVRLTEASVKGIADVSVLTGARGVESLNGLKSGDDEIKLRNYTLGVKEHFGYEAPGASVTVIRLHTK